MDIKPKGIAMSKQMIEGNIENWENGTLGTDANHAKAAPDEIQKKVDEALGLQAISIRLNADLIDTFKKLAAYHGVGYQPLMRDALRRFAEGEMKQIMIANMPSKLPDEDLAPQSEHQASRKKAA
jgi:uncharacterized protein (DUF4415 family)